MAKFLSYDGIDKNGVRAEVMVQTGTGRIKNISGRGKENPDGSYRNVEVEFDPDNPKLQHKVYALLDTTAKELWDYVQEAHLAKKDISYRIESQRRRNVDRALKFEDLKHSEQVVRVLASVDTVFSHEALTSPAEDPDSGAPSALNNAASTTPVSAVGSGDAMQALSAARSQGLPDSIVDSLAALALAQGYPASEVLAAGFASDNDRAVRSFVGNSRAVEEKPWNFTNTDGRINAGSYAVAHAATAERFALDHLVMLYSAGKKTNVSVNDDMIAQAASLAIEILEAADSVQGYVVGRIDRQKNSYNRALSLILDSIEKRNPVPIGGEEEDVDKWRDSVVTEASERFVGILMVADGKKPTVDDLQAWTAGQTSPAETVLPVTPSAPKDQAPEPAIAKVEASSEEVLQTSLGAQEITSVESTETKFTAPTGLPVEGEDGFVPPSAEDIEVLRDLCVEAGIVDNPKAISDWLERTIGVRSARKAHADVVGAFLDFYTAAGSDRVRYEVVGAHNPAA